MQRTKTSNQDKKIKRSVKATFQMSFSANTKFIFLCFEQIRCHCQIDMICIKMCTGFVYYWEKLKMYCILGYIYSSALLYDSVSFSILSHTIAFNSNPIVYLRLPFLFSFFVLYFVISNASLFSFPENPIRLNVIIIL